MSFSRSVVVISGLWGCARQPPAPVVAAREGAAVEVTLDDGRVLLVGASEVTQRAWREQMGTDPSYYAACDTCPVGFVSWYDAATYANRLSAAQGLEVCYALTDCAPAPEWSRKTQPGTPRLHPAGLRCAEPVAATPGCSGWRLPTRAEWLAFSPVMDPAEPRRSIQRRATLTSGSTAYPLAVASSEANDLGLYDTVGNMDEWLEDAVGPAAEASEERAAEAAWCTTAGNCFGTKMSVLLEEGRTEREVAAWGRHCLGFRVVRTVSVPAPLAD